MCFTAVYVYMICMCASICDVFALWIHRYFVLFICLFFQFDFSSFTIGEHFTLTYLLEMWLLLCVENTKWENNRGRHGKMTREMLHSRFTLSFLILFLLLFTIIRQCELISTISNIEKMNIFANRNGITMWMNKWIFSWKRHIMSSRDKLLPFHAFPIFFSIRCICPKTCSV